MQTKIKYALLLGAVSNVLWALTVSKTTTYSEEKVMMDSPQKPPEAPRSPVYQQGPLHRKNATLEFIHITKTGGSAIEAAAARHGVVWGVCHFTRQHGIGPGCSRPDFGWPRSPPTVSKGFSGELWHTPPAWMNPNPYAGARTFTVVRNPYDRIISEYYCPHYGNFRKWRHAAEADASIMIRHGLKTPESSSRVRNIGRHGPTKTHQQLEKSSMRENRDTPDALNRWVLHELKRFSFQTGHLLPQHHYCFDENNNQIVTHILRYENLENDFRRLMEEYELPVQLLKKNANTLVRKVTKHDLYPETVLMINFHMARDFDLLGYNRIQA